jgi:MOSC domain-containing protein YiiM
MVTHESFCAASSHIPVSNGSQCSAVAKLVSVNVGMPKDVGWSDRTVYTGVWKAPTNGPRMVRRLNIDGDGQGDLDAHVGEHRAVQV